MQNSVKDRLKILIDLLGLSLKDFSSKTGIPYRTIQSYLSGINIPGGENLQKICAEFSVNINWLLTGEGEPFLNKHKEPEKPIVITSNEEKPNYDDFVFIPMVAGKISAGGGLIPDNTIELRLAFRKDWVKRHGNPRHMSLIRVSGDSMEPTLYSGDIVLVDHNKNYIDPNGGIYAVVLDDSILIKRLQVIYPSKKVHVISDNPKYEKLEVDIENIAINGKVIWFAREIEK
jgi:phage repressor protein C with HTH and peptisase S24 domain